MRLVIGMIPAPKLPLLTPAEAFGPDLERFRNRQQTFISWRDKQLQSWTFNGQLKTSRGRLYGFQLRFVDRRTQNDFFGAVPTRWLKPRVFAAHFSLADAMNSELSKVFRSFERGGVFSKTSGFAADDRFHIEVGGWNAFQRDDGSFTLSINAEEISLHLDLRQTAPLVYHGQSGYVDHQSRSSFYCSAPRLAATGRLIIDDKLEDVTGVVWLDHEKLTGSAEKSDADHDRIALQFESGENLLISDQGTSTFATWIDSSGNTQHLISSEIRLTNTEYWISPRTGARYPIKRHIRLEPLNREFDIKPTVIDQELDLMRSMFSCAWEGAISAPGAVGFMSLHGKDHRRATRALEFLVR